MIDYISIGVNRDRLYKNKNGEFFIHVLGQSISVTKEEAEKFIEKNGIIEMDGK